MSNIFNRLIKGSIYLLVFLLPLFFTTSVSEIHEFNKSYLILFLVILAFLAWMAQMILIDRELRFRRTPLDLPILAFAGIAVLSAVFSVDPFSSLFGYYGRVGDGLIILIPLILLYSLIVNKTSAGNDGRGISVEGILKALLVSTFLVVVITYFSVLGFWQNISQTFNLNLPWQILTNSFNPTAYAAGGLAMYLSVILLVVVGLFLSSTKKLLKGIPLAILFFSILGLLIIIDYDASWLVILISLFIFISFALWKRVFRVQINRLMITILLVIIAAIFLIPGVSSRNLQYDENSKIIARIVNISPEIVLDTGTNLIIAKGALTENIKSVFLGTGIGTFYYDFAKFKPADINQQDYWAIRFNRSGSHIIEILATMGILGLFFYLSIVAIIILIIWFLFQSKIKTKSQESPMSELSPVTPLLLGFIGLLISQLIFYQTVVSAFLFWLFLGLLIVVLSLFAGDSKMLKGPIKEKVISFKNFQELALVFNVIFLVLVLLIGWLWFTIFQFYLAEISYTETLTGQKDTQQIMDNLEKKKYNKIKKFSPIANPFERRISNFSTSWPFKPFF